MSKPILILVLVVVAVLGAGAAYLWLPRRIVVDQKFDPNVKV